MKSMLPAESRHDLVVLSPIGAMTPGNSKECTPSRPTDPTQPDMIYRVGGVFLENGAGLFTTGMVTLQATMQAGLPVRSVKLTGYDNRTAMGVGNIQLVSGLLLNRRSVYGGSAQATALGWKMRIQVIPEPAPSLGFAAGALALLLVGLRRARLRRESRP